MVVLEQQLERAKQWTLRVEKMRQTPIVHFKLIDAIYQDAKNIPVNFQDLMTEVKQRRTSAENINNRIQDAMIVRKTRQRVGESKKQTKKIVEESSQPDKEAYLRTLLHEAGEMGLQSDQVSKLQNKLNDIDKWQAEVASLFKNSNEEISNYKRYRDHYKSLLARSSVFQIELGFMKDMKKKCSFIDWRDKVEDIVDKLVVKERQTLE